VSERIHIITILVNRRGIAVYPAFGFSGRLGLGFTLPLLSSLLERQIGFTFGVEIF
jgi:hypothetical protein